MNSLTGIIVAALFICSLAGPAMGEMSETASAGKNTAGHPLSSPEDGAGRVRVNSFLDRFAGIASSNTSSRESYSAFLAMVPSISESTLYSAFTRAGSPMSAYYSRLGTDSEQAVAAISRSAAFVMPSGAEHFILPGEDLASLVQGHLVGSGAVVGSAEIAPMPAATPSQVVIVKPQTPIPLPFFLTGSGLLALLALRKREWIQQ